MRSSERWYCRWHLAAINSGLPQTEIARITDELKSDPPTEKPDWRDELSGYAR